MKFNFRCLSLFFVGFLLFASTDVYSDSDAQDGSPKRMKQLSAALPPIKKISEDVFRVGGVQINKKELSATIKGQVNMSDGLVEYLACTPSGKLHESVLVLFAEPYHIQISLLMLGLKPGDRPIDFQGAPQLPCGHPVQISVLWQKGDQWVEYDPESLLLNIKDKTAPEKAVWVFSGSQVFGDQYMAQVEGSIAAIYHDPYAIFDHRNPSGADDTLFYVNKEIVPDVGYPVIFKIQSIADMSLIERTKCKQIKN